MPGVPPGIFCWQSCLNLALISWEKKYSQAVLGDTQDRDERYDTAKRQVEEELAQKRTTECTFAPKTLHKQHKQMIESILMQPDDDQDFY